MKTRRRVVFMGVSFCLRDIFPAPYVSQTKKQAEPLYNREAGKLMASLYDKEFLN
jgi:hypothetical protein